MRGIDLAVEIQEDETTIERLIMEDLVVQLNKLFIKAKKPLQKITGDLLTEYIRAQPEWSAITNGSLRYELGIVNPTARLLNIVDTLTQNIEIIITPLAIEGKYFKGGITINAVKSDYSDIIHLRDSIVVTEKGVELEWLRWLLLEGRSIIIDGYSVEFGAFGRTGGARMILGGNWKVPNPYDGRANDNFIITAIKQMREPLEKKIEECLASI